MLAADCQNLRYGPTEPVMLEDATELQEHVEANLSFLLRKLSLGSAAADDIMLL